MRSAVAILVGFAIAIAAAPPAAAQTTPGLESPFLTATELLQGRNASAASVELAVTLERGGAPAQASLVRLAPDWAADVGESTKLYDFRRGRLLTLTGDDFSSQSLVGPVAFRVYEYQNRSGMSQLAKVLPPAALRGLSACDSAVELAVVLPIRDYAERARTRRDRNGGAEVATCGGREVGRFQLSDVAAPPSLWPFLAHTLPMHPDMLAAMKRSGRVPILVETRSESTRGERVTRWRAQVRPTSSAYPLTAELRNRTADTLPDGLGPLADAAVSGRASPRPLADLTAWDAALAETLRVQGEAQAQLDAFAEVGVYGATNPCAPQTPTFCGLLRSMNREGTDAAVVALRRIISAEQGNKPQDAVTAFRAAQGSPLKDHPALLASFSLALDKGAAAAARRAGLPSDAAALRRRVLNAQPYNPSYWTDAGDAYARSYQWPTAYALYEVALSLPTTPAAKATPTITSKRETAARLRRDFPQFWLD